MTGHSAIVNNTLHDPKSQILNFVDPLTYIYHPKFFQALCHGFSYDSVSSAVNILDVACILEGTLECHSIVQL